MKVLGWASANYLTLPYLRLELSNYRIILYSPVLYPIPALTIHIMKTCFGYFVYEPQDKDDENIW